MKKINDSYDKWQALAARVGGECTNAMRDYYERIYSKELPEWFAGLYDTEIGGFYFSNSARDNDRLIYEGETFGLLPDADSTWQAFVTMVSMGMTGGKHYRDVIPEWMQKKTVAFLKGLQDPDGYFYHPQFGRKRNEEKANRRSRDTGRALAVIKAFGAMPTYDSPMGDIGDGILADGTPAAKPVSKAREEAPATEKKTAMALFMKDADTFREYLDTLTLRNNSYSTGSFFITQSSELKYRDRQLAESGAGYSLFGILTDWLTEHQLENGIWDDVKNYAGTSGIMKICRLYSMAGVMLPNAEKTVRAAIYSITSDEEAKSVTDVFNPWVATSVIISDLRKIGGEAGAEIARRITDELIENAPRLIRATADKLVRFKRADGAYSYPVNASGGYNMGMPLGIKGIDEGDMNATHLVMGAVSNIYTAMDIADIAVAPYGEDDMQRFLDIVENKRKG